MKLLRYLAAAMLLSGTAFASSTAVTTGQYTNPTTIAQLAAMTDATARLSSNQHMLVPAQNGAAGMLFDYDVTTTGLACPTPSYIAAGNAYICPSDSVAPSVGRWVLALPKSTQTLGTIYTADTWASLSGFTSNGVTPTIVTCGAKQCLRFPSSSATYANRFDYNYVTELPQWTYEIEYTLDTFDGASGGLGPGTDGGTTGIVGFYDSAYGDPAFGKVYVGGPGGTLVGSTATLNSNLNDKIRVSVTRNYNTATTCASNLTTGDAPVCVSYTYSLSYPAGPGLPQTGKFAIFNFGGIKTVTKMTISSPVQKNATFAFDGDSKITGYYAGAYGDVAASLVQAHVPSIVEAGPGDPLSACAAIAPEIIALAPKYVILNCGRNDLAVGVPLATVEANYAALVSTFEAAGIPVINLLPIYETVVDQTDFTAWIVATYPGKTIDSGCQAYSANPSTVLVADGVHPNKFCNLLIANAILDYANRAGISTTYQSYFDAAISSTSGQLTLGKLTVGSLTPAVARQMYVGSNSTQTDTTVHFVQNLLQTNDDTFPFALSVDVIGGATADVRRAILQTDQDGGSNTGILDLQHYGGDVSVGSTHTASQLIVKALLNVGNITNNSAGQNYIMSCNYDMTNTLEGRCGTIGQSSDVSGPFVAFVNQKGAALAANRIMRIGTCQDGTTCSGNLDLQSSGLGNVGIGINGVPVSPLEVGGNATFDAGIVVGAPTGGFEGTGTVNATGLFVNGTAVLTSAASVPASSLTGTTNFFTNAMLAQGAANTFKGNNTGSTANEVDMTVAQAWTLLGTTPSANIAGAYSGITALSGLTGQVSISNGNTGSTSALLMGADAGATTRTDATSKWGSILAYPYTNAGKPTTLMAWVNTNSVNSIQIGGGSGSSTVASSTELDFYTAAAVNTTTGTLAFKITSDQLWNLGANADVATGTAAVAGTGSLGPTGTACVISGWEKIKDHSANTRYRPYFTCS